ncbi:MAG: hypothetical protein Q4G33_07740 [bacterium]|nr:hypothetical protein [bacterium]
MSESNLRLIFADYEMDIQLPKDIPKYRDSFKNACYSKWAVNELMLYIMRKKEQSPIKSTEEFIKMVDAFSKKTEKDKAVWSIAKYVATDILDIFYAMQ